MWKRYSRVDCLNRSIIPGIDCAKIDSGNNGWRQLQMSRNARKVIGQCNRAQRHRNMNDWSVRTLGKLCISHWCVGSTKLNDIRQQVIDASATTNRLIVDIESTFGCRERRRGKHLREKGV